MYFAFNSDYYYRSDSKHVIWHCALLHSFALCITCMIRWTQHPVRIFKGTIVSRLRSTSVDRQWPNRLKLRVKAEELIGGVSESFCQHRYATRPCTICTQPPTQTCHLVWELDAMLDDSIYHLSGRQLQWFCHFTDGLKETLTQEGLGSPTF